MRSKTRKSNIRNRTDLSLEDIAKLYNPMLRGWIGYYGCYYRSELDFVFSHFNKTLVAWVMRKYKRFKGHKKMSSSFLEAIAKNEPNLFAHWKLGWVRMCA